MRLWIAIVLTVAILSQCTECTHFGGATIQWRPVYSATNFTGKVSEKSVHVIAIFYTSTLCIDFPQIVLTHHISWTRTSNEGGDCDETVVMDRGLLGHEYNDGLDCSLACEDVYDTECSCPEDSVRIGDLSYYCTDYSIEDNWAAGERSYNTTAFSGLSYFEAS